MLFRVTVKDTYIRTTDYVCIYARDCSDTYHLSVLVHATGTSFGWFSLPQVLFKLDFKVKVRV